MAGLGRIWAAADWPCGWTVLHVAETGSTNADLLAAYERGLVSDRTALVTDHQTAGRGRLDRRWEAPPGANLLVSMLFEEVPDVPAELTQRVGLAAVAAARGQNDGRPGRSFGLKWPNDVLVDDRKLGGILAQRAAAGGVVVGLGLNLAWAPPGAGRLGPHVRPATTLAALLVAFDSLGDDVHEAYREALVTLGRTVSVELPDGRTVVGRAVDVDPHGRLVVRDDDGVTSVFDVGDVVHARPDPRPPD